MITDRDITKLKSVFATKDDLTAFATKKDLNAFATKGDLTAFATKGDMATLATAVARIETNTNGLQERMARVEVGVSDLNESVSHLEGHMIHLNGRVEELGDAVRAMDEKLDGYVVSVDAIAGKYDMLVMENGAGGLVLARHTRQIETLAKGARIKLPD
ncbi:MAG: hypothetical protein QOE22_231 [Candidatus Parcubacteria bacterium]|jgi:predicted nuclease with TOPRIM domain|nr:hypothetical protein [Candidatus Parcubacteria bacterium]